ncbi:MAG: cytochrome C [Deltaproteobacteria bacterium]|nr:cytochrome C [Deltaproteobacteria bacterium]
MCVWCHTPRTASGQLDTAKLLAGGTKLEVAGIGTVYASNLTPDKETGLGNWTAVEIKQAILGFRPDKDRVAPPMPFAQHAKLSGEDLDHIVAYLQSVPTLKNAVPKAELKMERKDLPRPPRRSGPQDTPTDAAIRGRYVVEAVAACGSCHTPKRETGEEDPTKFLAGSPVPYAPNITPDKETGTGNWSKAELLKLIKEGATKVSRTLPPAVHPTEAYATMSESDLQQAVDYLVTVPPIVNPVPKP